MHSLHLQQSHSPRTPWPLKKKVTHSSKSLGSNIPAILLTTQQTWICNNWNQKLGKHVIWTKKYVLCFFLGNSLASEFYMPTFLRRRVPTHPWRCNRQSVPKRWHIKFTRQGITQKKAYNIQNTVTVGNQKYVLFGNKYSKGLHLVHLHICKQFNFKYIS